MSDLISRKAAIEAIDKNRKDLLSLGMDGAEHILVHYGRRVIEELPTAERVVRCKDCKWYEIYQLKKDGTDDRRYKPSYCVNLAFHPRPNWFCADGEEREDERT